MTRQAAGFEPYNPRAAMLCMSNCRSPSEVHNDRQQAARVQAISPSVDEVHHNGGLVSLNRCSRYLDSTNAFHTAATYARSAPDKPPANSPPSQDKSLQAPRDPVNLR